MIKHSTSHGCATLACTVTAGLIVGLLHRFVPHFLDFLIPITTPVTAVLGGLSFFTPENVQVIILAALLALVWGIFFKLKTQN